MYDNKTFENLSDWELLAEIKKLKSNECQMLAEVERYLAEVDRFKETMATHCCLPFTQSGLGIQKGQRREE